MTPASDLTPFEALIGSGRWSDAAGDVTPSLIDSERSDASGAVTPSLMGSGWRNDAACDVTLPETLLGSGSCGRPAPPPSPYATVQLTMRALCCVATYATFYRELHDQKLSSVFFLLSPIPLVLLVLNRVPQLRHEVALLSTVTGLATGVVGGFLSETVGRPGDTPAHDTPSVYSDVIFHLELLHIPVLAGSVTYTYCLFFMSLPTPVRFRMLLLVSFSATVVITVGVTIMSGDMWVVTSHKSLLFIFVNLYLLAVCPVTTRPQRAWLLCIAGGWWWLHWQNGYFDYLAWDVSRPRFAVPAFMTGTIIIFLVQPPRPDRRQRALCDGSEELRQDVMLNGVVCFSVAYIVERFSMTVIKAKQAKQTGDAYSVPTSDVWISNAFMIAFLAVISPNLKATLTVKVGIILWGAFVYAAICLVCRCLFNAIFVDCILGLTIIFVIES